MCVYVCVGQIQRALLRNNQTQRFSQKQALRLHQGLVTSTAEQVCVCVCEGTVTIRNVSLMRVVNADSCVYVCEQVMERLCVRLQQQVCTLKGCEEEEEVQTARQILKEARDSRAVSTPPAGATGASRSWLPVEAELL